LGITPCFWGSVCSGLIETDTNIGDIISISEVIGDEPLNVVLAYKINTVARPRKAAEYTDPTFAKIPA